MQKMIDLEKYMQRKHDILEFIFENREKYDYNTMGCLALSFQFDALLDDDYPLTHPELELLSKFGILKERQDPYKMFKELLDERGFLSGHVVEVGAGIYPRLCEVIMEDKPSDLVSITAYDPRLIFDTIPGVKFVNKPFTKDTNIDDIDTLYGLFPCDASITLIDKAIEENKNLLIAFCGCDHSDSEHMKWFGRYWADDVCCDYREKYGKSIEIDKWNKEIDLKYPIMTYKKR